MVDQQLPLAGSLSESTLRPVCYCLRVQDGGVGRADSNAPTLHVQMSDSVTWTWSL
jgi:hypothetical protein